MKCSVLFFAVMIGACDTVTTPEDRPTFAHGSSASRFPVWKQIRLGGVKPADHAAELEEHGFEVNDRARDLLAKTLFASKSLSVDLVEVTVAKLGFPGGATTTEIYARALSLGLTRVPAEVGYWLCKELTDEPKGIIQRHIGMEPIADSDDLPYVFRVDHGDGGQWLGAFYAGPTDPWRAGDVWVFGRSI